MKEEKSLHLDSIEFLMREEEASTRASTSPVNSPKLLARANSRRLPPQSPKQQPSSLEPVLCDDQTTAKCWELGAPVVLTVWAEVVFGRRNARGGSEPQAAASARRLGRQPSESMENAEPETRVAIHGLRLAASNTLWLGWILKRSPSSASSGGTPNVEVGPAVLLNELALTSGTWAYAVAFAESRIHVCAVDVARLLRRLRRHLNTNAKRLRHEAKVQGAWPQCRLELRLTESQAALVWLCGSHDGTTAPLQRKWSLRCVAAVPPVGLIRQDLTWSISPLRAAFAESTGLKGSFLPINKFLKGFQRWASSRGSHLPAFSALQITAAPDDWVRRLRPDTDADSSEILLQADSLIRPKKESPDQQHSLPLTQLFLPHPNQLTG
eukprot:Protomagalhaensia_wolfi_Nauph_80__2955@NODE_302_length_2852_cov_52_750800_g226_i0_p2_GENE_NODE_302_length_2852_cov_52_750800_g226_i0NODE_302_length_2852_cov_52_750800_g226_i0_p2_ORF_typecomplete_len382_score51_25_NODE_302_length_2852_cov_52_750800_g226_i016802825